MMSIVGTERGRPRRTDEQIYADHARELVRFATVLTGPSGADDLVADAVLRAFTSPKWTDVDNPRAYLYRAVLNAAHEHERSRLRRARREQRMAAPELVETSHVRPEVLAAMGQLNPRQRAIVFFTYWQDRTSDEIAAELDITRRTVQRELAAARQILQRELS
jgi:RNA polymerase sigma factor (sigma-70 family)